MGRTYKQLIFISIDIFMLRHERLKALQIKRELALADIWNNSRTPSQSSLVTELS